jgi:hypothetical protein
MTIPIRIKPGVRLRGMGPQVALAITIAELPQPWPRERRRQ